MSVPVEFQASEARTTCDNNVLLAPAPGIGEPSFIKLEPFKSLWEKNPWLRPPDVCKVLESKDSSPTPPTYSGERRVECATQGTNETSVKKPTKDGGCQYKVTEKNTFLHVEPTLSFNAEGNPVRKLVSAPAELLGGSEDNIDMLVASRNSRKAETMPSSCGVVEEDEDQLCPAMADSPAEPAPSRKGRQAKRPCKSKRLRYKNLMARLEEKVREDPAGFDVESLQLPPSLVFNEKVLQKIKARLAALAADLCNGGNGETIPEDDEEEQDNVDMHDMQAPKIIVSCAQ